MIGLVIDIETTNLLTGQGLDAPYDPSTGYLKDDREILEVGYLRIEDTTGEIISHGTLYFYKPYFDVEKTQHIHGIDREFLKQYEEDFNRNLIILNSLIQKTLIIGKNSNSFDIPFINGFIDKHSKGLLPMASAVALSKTKDIDGSFISYTPELYTYDVQKAFKDEFRRLYEQKHGVSLHHNKRGTLMDYIEVLGLQDELDKLYENLDKERTTRAHGALYDCCATYLVWKHCAIKE